MNVKLFSVSGWSFSFLCLIKTTTWTKTYQWNKKLQKAVLASQPYAALLYRCGCVTGVVACASVLLFSSSVTSATRLSWTGGALWCSCYAETLIPAASLLQRSLRHLGTSHKHAHIQHSRQRTWLVYIDHWTVPVGVFHVSAPSAWLCGVCITHFIDN